jgi:hypothetical protein
MYLRPSKEDKFETLHYLPLRIFFYLTRDREGERDILYKGKNLQNVQCNDEKGLGKRRFFYLRRFSLIFEKY